MSEIWNLSTLCRCCHADGHYKSLNLSYQGKNDVEIYETMLRETLGIFISTQPVPLESSYTICDTCIFKLRDATEFKNQVLMCEEKFKFYCNNEQLGSTCDIKTEVETDECDLYNDHEIDENWTLDVKKEYNIEVDIKHPIIKVNKENLPRTETVSIASEHEMEKMSEKPEEILKTTGNINRQKLTKIKEQCSDTDSEYESGAPGPSTEKKLRTLIVYKQCVTTYSRQDFQPSETQSTDNKSRRSSPLQIIGDIVIEHDNNQMEVDDENQKLRQIIGVRLNEAPKTSAERGREFRARKALLKQQRKQQQEPNAIVEIATEDIRSAGPPEDNQVPGPSEIRTIEKRAKSAEATRRWRQKKKGVSGSSKKQAKTAAQRMREYRERKKTSVL